MHAESMMMKGQTSAKRACGNPFIRYFQKWVSPLMKDPLTTTSIISQHFFHCCCEGVKQFHLDREGGRRKEVLSSLYFPFKGREGNGTERKGREGKA
jgi:hypothetical protein